MNKRRHKTEKIIHILRKVDGKQTVEGGCREHNASEQTFYPWRRNDGRMELADVSPSQKRQTVKSLVHRGIGLINQSQLLKI